ncbi:hypothetical protein [Komarekiella delphini-convector]|nr:hypothetical protein [Komarekiella delphini-convector]
MQEEQIPGKYSLKTALEDALCELVIYDSIPQDLYDTCSQLEGLTVDEAETLLEALHHLI